MIILLACNLHQLFLVIHKPNLESSLLSHNLWLTAKLKTSIMLLIFHPHSSLMWQQSLSWPRELPVPLPLNWATQCFYSAESSIAPKDRCNIMSVENKLFSASLILGFIHYKDFFSNSLQMLVKGEVRYSHLFL